MILSSLKFNNFSDNFDAERFNFDGQGRSRGFDLNARIFFFSWFFARREKLFEAYSSLFSEQSKLLYICLIVYRLAGHLAFKIPVDFLSRPKELEAFRNAEKFTESQYPVTGMFGKLQHLTSSLKENAMWRIASGLRPVCIADCIFSLLLYVKEHPDFYKFYIGHYTIHQEETVLYCAPISR